jgi:hypothetical protein
MMIDRAAAVGLALAENVIRPGDPRSDQEDVIAYKSSTRIDGCAVTTTCPLQFQQATSLSTGVRPATSHVSQCQAAITT